MPTTEVVSVTGLEILDQILKETPRIAVHALNSATQSGGNFLVQKFVDAGVAPGLASRKVTVTRATASNMVSAIKYKVNAIRLTGLQQVGVNTITSTGQTPAHSGFLATVKASIVGKRPAVTGVFARESRTVHKPHAAGHALKIDMLYNRGDTTVSDSDRDDMIDLVVNQFKDEVVARFNALHGE